MTKVACPNCGHKNKAPLLICDNCGNYMGDYDSPAAAGSSAATTETGYSSTDSRKTQRSGNQVSPSPGDTITIKAGGIWYRSLPILLAVIAMLAYVVATLEFSVSSYLLLPLLMVMFGAPPLTRQLMFPIKFNRDGFVVPDNGRNVLFSYGSISNAVVRNPAQGVQSVALSMDSNESPVTLDFDQMLPLRQFVSQLSRRRIPVSLDRPATPS